MLAPHAVDIAVIISSLIGIITYFCPMSNCQMSKSGNAWHNPTKKIQGVRTSRTTGFLLLWFACFSNSSLLFIIFARNFIHQSFLINWLQFAFSWLHCPLIIIFSFKISWPVRCLQILLSISIMMTIFPKGFNFWKRKSCMTRLLTCSTRLSISWATN